MESTIQFLKLGGSLITDKTTPRTPRLDIITQISNEIAEAREANPDLNLVLGHGSGSFGHVPAKKYGTRQGVNSPEGWLGFVEVWKEAFALNHIVMKALHGAGLPAVAFPASGAVITSGGQVTRWNLNPLRAALEAGLLPVVFGDVVFDETLGGTILSTEDIFYHLAKELHPERILLAGLDEGVYRDYPHCKDLIVEINSENWPKIAPGIGASNATDVTGGMASKVELMLQLTQTILGLQVIVFSGSKPGNILTAFSKPIGTRIAVEKT